MRCPICSGYCEKVWQDVMVCLRCGRKELSSNDEKNIGLGGY